MVIRTIYHLRLFDALNLPNPLNKWTDLPLLLIDLENPSSRPALKTMDGIVTIEVITAALYAIWLNYNESIKFVQEYADPDHPQPEEIREEALLDFHAFPEVRTNNHFNNLLASAIHLLPFHQRALDNDHAFEYGMDPSKKGPSRREINLLPRLAVDFRDLSDEHINLYSRYWTRNNIIASIRQGCLRLRLREMDATFDFMYR